MLHPFPALLLAASPATHLSVFDLALVALYLIAITLFGLRFREKRGESKGPKSLKTYFLANNTIPWWAIALSIVSAETSTLTIISVPGVAFAGNFGFLQLVIGYMVGRIVVSALFLPRYFAGEMLTAYQLIDQRFGPFLHKVTAALFLFTRAAAEGVRVFAVSIVVGIAIGTGDVLSIAIISALTLLYTFEGGITAVIWTDVVQMFIYIIGTVVAIFTLGAHISGGWHTIHAVAGTAGKFHMLDFTFDLTKTYTFWAGVLGGTFLTMASHGTDQLMVQRMLAARNLRESRLALLSSGAVIFLQFTLFLFIGAGLYVFYTQRPASFASADRIFPTFIVREMPIGVAGLLVAAILAAAMSNLSAALNSLSSTTVVDFYMRVRPEADSRERTTVSKSTTILWAVILFGIAVYSVRVGGKGHVVEIGLSIASVAYGCLLGVFLLGTLTRFANQWGTSIGMISGFALNVWLWRATFPIHIGGFTVPRIAYPWYTLIGAAATFLVGSLASIPFVRTRKPSRVAVAALLLFSLTSAFCPTAGAEGKKRHSLRKHLKLAQSSLPKPELRADFTAADTLINDAISKHKLPGAVLLVGHDGQIIYHHAYGNRKIAGEAGIDGMPSPAEPMTEDTIFDMASLTKCLATATAIMQLYEQGKLRFDDPIQTYLPEFNPSQDVERAKVTVRMLLTHYSGEPADVSLKDSWGLVAPDRSEGFHRALMTPLQSAPAATFRYSDINFILLGMLVEKLSGQTEDVYTLEHIFRPLGMTSTRYRPISGCNPYQPTVSSPLPPRDLPARCPELIAAPQPLQRIAPTAHDDEGSASTNPTFDRLLTGFVHDPTTRRMGGVAGHAGVFSTARDVALYAQALLDKLLYDKGPFPLQQSTLQIMTRMQQPGANAQQLIAAGIAQQAALANRDFNSDPNQDLLLAPAYPAIKGQSLRAFGWDIDTAFSKPRGVVFPIGSFGHTGFTGTTLWIDPQSNTYYVLLSNAIHPRGNPPISNLRGEVATAISAALQLYGFCADVLAACHTETAAKTTLTGLDALEWSHFAELATIAAQHNNQLRLGLLTNQSGIDSQHRRTIDVLSTFLPEAIPSAHLVTLFSPEHGIAGRFDSTRIGAETDAATGLHVTSLYGAKDSDKRPSHEQLKDLDAVVIDLQDAGVHFWTYETILGYFLEASAQEQRAFNHKLDIVVLDRPNPIGGTAVQGPIVDEKLESYTGYMPLPARHGMTFGELACYINRYKLDTATSNPLNAPLTVVRMQHWKRDEYFDQTGLTWTNPSPNLRSVEAAVAYPALGLIEGTNLSVGRGTETPFSFFGAGAPAKDEKTGMQVPAWFKASDVTAILMARRIPGVRFEATKIDISEDQNHYPYHGQRIEAVRTIITDRASLDAPELGIEILSALHKLYPTQFRLDRATPLVANQATVDAIARGEDPRDIAQLWEQPINRFKAAREAILLY